MRLNEGQKRVMMLSLGRQEAYRKRYARMRPGWQAGSLVYRDRVAARLTIRTRVLDLGCGRGGIMERLYPRTALVAGVDPDRTSLLEHRSRGLVLAVGRGERLPFADGAFNLVCGSWVLEHLPDPGAVFREVARVLAPGGRFIFLTPNARHPLLAANRALARLPLPWVERLYGRAEADTFPARYRANTPACIRRLAQDAGLAEVALRQVGDPTYLAFSEGLFQLACLVERIAPRGMCIHLVGEYVRGLSETEALSAGQR